MEAHRTTAHISIQNFHAQPNIPRGLPRTQQYSLYSLHSLAPHNPHRYPQKYFGTKIISFTPVTCSHLECSPMLQKHPSNTIFPCHQPTPVGTPTPPQALQYPHGAPRYPVGLLHSMGTPKPYGAYHYLEGTPIFLWTPNSPMGPHYTARRPKPYGSPNGPLISFPLPHIPPVPHTHRTLPALNTPCPTTPHSAPGPTSCPQAAMGQA